MDKCIDINVQIDNCHFPNAADNGDQLIQQSYKSFHLEF